MLKGQETGAEQESAADHKQFEPMLSPD